MYVPKVLGKVSAEDLSTYSTWCAQGFVVDHSDLPPAKDLCRIVERWTGRVIAYVPYGADGKDIVDLICQCGGGGPTR